MPDITYLYKYILRLSNKGFSTKTQTDIKNGVPVQYGTAFTATFSSTAMEFSLYGVSFRRKVYEPGHIEAEILIETAQSAPLTMDVLDKMLIRRPVQLLVQQYHMVEVTKGGITTQEPSNDKLYMVADNYYIHEISPQFETGNTKKEVVTTDDDGNKITKEETVSVNWTYIKLDIYSQDRLMTLDKHSQAHIGRKLVEDIVSDRRPDFTLTYNPLADGTSKDNTVDLQTETRTLHHLGYTANKKQEELIHPYLVQYNETFYDFLRRTANRCGEVFYFEDGALCFGVSGATSKSITDAARIVYQRISQWALPVTEFSRDTLKQWDSKNKTYEPEDALSDPVPYGKYNVPTDACPDYKGKFPYNSEIASEDHYLMLFKNKFAHDSVDELWKGDAAEHTLRDIQILLESTSLMEVIAKFGIREIESAIKVTAKSKKTTDKWNEILEEESIDPDKKYAVRHMKVDKDTSHWITLDYLSKIKKGEREQMGRMICIDMGTGFSEVGLGSRITIPSDTTNTYVVVRIDMTSDNKWARDYDWDEMPRAGKDVAQTHRIYAIPMAGTVFYPPLLPDSPFRQAGPQPAFVTDNDDPSGQGRVRVRYPWQPSLEAIDDDIKKEDYKNKKKNAKEKYLDAKKELQKYATDITEPETGDPTAKQKSGTDNDDYSKAFDDFKSKFKAYRTAKENYDKAMLKRLISEAATPWVRMSTPMATSGGGMFFKPEKGDEVMVAYENNNIERPFVSSTLYSKNVPAPKEGERVIVSKNGHTIKINDPTNATELFANLFPVLKLASSFGVKAPGLDGVATRALGGIELTDQLGLYNIKMSSENRSISISSPFGNVRINAFTGISISAPNGDISIIGKNINLKAFNKIRISSGANVKMGVDRFKNRSGWFTSIANPKNLGESIGKAVAETAVAKAFDFSLYRHLIEIFIRPVDGTLQISSGRFLLLESGNGKATGEVADYNVSKFTSDSIYDSEILTDLINYMTNAVSEWGNGFKLFYKDLKTAVTKPELFNAWNGPNAKITAPADLLTVVKDFFALDPATLNDPHQIAARFTQYVGNVTFANSTNAEEQTLKNQLNKLMETVLCIKKQMQDLDHIFDGIQDGSFVSHPQSRKRAQKVVKGTLINEALDIVKMQNPIVTAPRPSTNATSPSATAAGASAQGGIYTGKGSKILDFMNGNGSINDIRRPLPDNLVDAWIKFVNRRLASLMIEKCRSNAGNPFGGFFIAPAAYPNDIHGQPTAPSNTETPYSDADWPKYVTDIHLEHTKTKLDKFLENDFVSGFTGAFMKQLPWESDVWSSEKGGQILFSQEKSKSIRFDDNGLTQSYDHKNREDLSETNIKTTLNGII